MAIAQVLSRTTTATCTQALLAWQRYELIRQADSGIVDLQKLGGEQALSSDERRVAAAIGEAFEAAECPLVVLRVGVGRDALRGLWRRSEGRTWLGSRIRVCGAPGGAVDAGKGCPVRAAVTSQADPDVEGVHHASSFR
jgi:hypothetical protein